MWKQRPSSHYPEDFNHRMQCTFGNHLFSSGKSQLTPSSSSSSSSTFILSLATASLPILSCQLQELPPHPSHQQHGGRRNNPPPPASSILLRSGRRRPFAPSYYFLGLGLFYDSCSYHHYQYNDSSSTRFARDDGRQTSPCGEAEESDPRCATGRHNVRRLRGTLGTYVARGAVCSVHLWTCHA